MYKMQRQREKNKKCHLDEEEKMATLVLIVGDSGTGKTSSIRGFQSGEVSVFSAAKKPLPFKNAGENKIYYETIAGYDDLKSKLRMAKNKSIVIDDAQYLMAFEYFSSLNENGFEKYTRMGNNFFTILKIAGQLKSDKIIYFMMHIDRNDNGIEKAKTLGKLIEDKLTLEGLFTIVLKTVVRDKGNGRQGYFFATVNSGSDRVKTPMEMFDEPLIPNNLKTVDRIIRNYYELPANEVFLDQESKAGSETYVPNKSVKGNGLQDAVPIGLHREGAVEAGSENDVPNKNITGNNPLQASPNGNLHDGAVEKQQSKGGNAPHVPVPRASKGNGLQDASSKGDLQEGNVESGSMEMQKDESDASSEGDDIF